MASIYFLFCISLILNPPRTIVAFVVASPRLVRLRIIFYKLLASPKYLRNYLNSLNSRFLLSFKNDTHIFNLRWFISITMFCSLAIGVSLVPIDRMPSPLQSSVLSEIPGFIYRSGMNPH